MNSLCFLEHHYDFRYKWQREMNDFRGAKYVSLIVLKTYSIKSYKM